MRCGTTLLKRGKTLNNEIGNENRSFKGNPQGRKWHILVNSAGSNSVTVSCHPGAHLLWRIKVPKDVQSDYSDRGAWVDIEIQRGIINARINRTRKLLSLYF